MSQVQIIGGAFLGREIAEKNEEVLLVIGFALFPSLFGGLVSVSPVDGCARAFRYEVLATGNSYVLYLRDLARIALDFAQGSGRAPEILREASEDESPPAREIPAGCGAGRDASNVLSFSRQIPPERRR